MREMEDGSVDETTGAAAEEFDGANLPEEPAERVRAVVTRVVRAMGIDEQIDVDENEEEIRVLVHGDDVGLLIGKHGSTIDALQHLAVRIAFGRGDERKSVVIDAAGYRERREAALRRAADQAVA